MILIADGGSTKCDWVVADTSNATIVKRFISEGINPYSLTPEQITTLLNNTVAPQTESYPIEHIFRICNLRMANIAK